VNVSVKILKFELPGFGASMTTEVAARYELQDRANGDIIYSEDVSSTGYVPADYAFSGATRVVESGNRAVQNNISRFLQSLETIDLNKPKFPAAASN
jgi:hypothetical protein